MLHRKSLCRALLLSIMILMSLAITIGYADSTRRVAIIPPIDYAKYGEPELNKLVLTELKENFINQQYNVALDTQVEKAVNEATQGKALKSLPKKELLKEISYNLSSDLVVAVEFTRLSSIIIPTMYSSNEMRQVSITAAIYHAKTDTYKTFNYTRNETSESDGYRGIKRLTMECIDQLLRKTNKYLTSLSLH
ncbi:hypothetical protein [Dendrosporobacter sp. 1207_IL3150]|uniref:hypothetical protein n=1 Tax=Dendrosporobacter sp. 1207_IL3150 TaxID=3084054 RepID=UPI002FD93966